MVQINSEALVKDGITSAAIHGNKSQGARTKALDDFKLGNVKSSCGNGYCSSVELSIEPTSHVINFELPNIAEDYVHGIGRTGRAGNDR